MCLRRCGPDLALALVLYRIRTVVCIHAKSNFRTLRRAVLTRTARLSLLSDALVDMIVARLGADIVNVENSEESACFYCL